MAGLYIHVPFCGAICSYCHFSRTAEHQRPLRERYVEAVVREFDLRRKACSVLRGSRPLATAYVGGGTPSQLEPDLMRRLLAGTVGRLEQTPDFELTAEANPESFTEEIARCWSEAGINRISLGVQSLDARVLALLGRQCQPRTARRALALAGRTFSRVSADWIIGPGLARSGLLAELDEALSLGVEHFSLYILELHEGTKLARQVAAGKTTLPADSETEALYLAVVEHLAGQGIHQYEVSNFCRPGAESRHNRNYWRRQPWLGLGPAAHGGYGRRRYANLADVERYCSTVERGNIPEATTDPLDLQARLLERMILSLRTREGVPLEWLADGRVDLEAGRQAGYWRLDQQRLTLTSRGFLLIDGIEEMLARGLHG